MEYKLTIGGELEDGAGMQPTSVVNKNYQAPLENLLGDALRM